MTVLRHHHIKKKISHPSGKHQEILLYFDRTHYDALLQSHFQSDCSHTVHIHWSRMQICEFSLAQIIHVTHFPWKFCNFSDYLSLFLSCCGCCWRCKSLIQATSSYHSNSYCSMWMHKKAPKLTVLLFYLDLDLGYIDLFPTLYTNRKNLEQLQSKPWKRCKQK